MTVQRCSVMESQADGARPDVEPQGDGSNGGAFNDMRPHAVASSSLSSSMPSSPPPSADPVQPKGTSPTSMTPTTCARSRSVVMRMGIVSCIIVFSFFSDVRTTTFLVPISSSYTSTTDGNTPATPQANADTMSPGAKTSITPAAVINQPKQPTVAKTPCDRQFAVSATEFDVDPTKKPLCIQKFYGNNCNRMITLAKALYLASEMSTMLQLDDAWSRWFVRFFDPHPRISLSHMFVVSNGTATLNPEHNPNALQTTQCIKRVQADEVYRTMEPVSVAVHRGVRVPMLDQLVPKRSIREEAERQVQKRYANGKQAVSVSDEGNAIVSQPAMTSTDVQNSMEPSQNPLQYPFVSVHRRWLGGGCLDAANKPHRHFDNCTVSSLVATCEYTHNAVLQTLNQQSSSLSTNGLTADESSSLIVLFTDGQNEDYDSTFPIRDPNEFALQLWMMTLSQQHFGSPLSTVDIVVRHWRHHRIQQHENAKPGSNPPRNDIVHPIECNPSWV